ncbi:MAG: enoyl-CoA hydratase-related protein, partial [Smithella sp.]
YLPRMLTPCRAMEILLTSNNFSARKLCDWGFLNKVVDRSELMNETMEMAMQIASNGPRAIQGIIRCLREARDLGREEAFAKELEIGLPIFSGKDAREGILAQKEKRKPVFD